MLLGPTGYVNRRYSLSANKGWQIFSQPLRALPLTPKSALPEHHRNASSKAAMRFSAACNA